MPYSIICVLNLFLMYNNNLLHNRHGRGFHEDLVRNIYAPNFKMSSGENKDDTILNASKHHWLYKKIKTIKASNKKLEKDEREDGKKALPVLSQAPTNLNQDTEIYPEAVAYLVFKENPVFQVGRKRFAQSPPVPGEEDEDSTLRPRMTLTGSFKSGKGQHSNKLSEKNVESQDKARAAIMHAKKAASKQKACWAPQSCRQFSRQRSLVCHQMS